MSDIIHSTISDSCQGLSYNQTDFHRDESVDSIGLSLLTTDRTTTSPYNTFREFDIKELDVTTFYKSPAQGRVHQRHPHPHRCSIGV